MTFQPLEQWCRNRIIKFQSLFHLKQPLTKVIDLFKFDSRFYGRGVFLTINLNAAVLQFPTPFRGNHEFVAKRWRRKIRSRSTGSPREVHRRIRIVSGLAVARDNRNDASRPRRKFFQHFVSNLRRVFERTWQKKGEEVICLWRQVWWKCKWGIGQRSTHTRCIKITMFTVNRRFTSNNNYGDNINVTLPVCTLKKKF